jgi:hypothetical protein
MLDPYLVKVATLLYKMHRNMAFAYLFMRIIYVDK